MAQGGSGPAAGGSGEGAGRSHDSDRIPEDEEDEEDSSLLGRPPAASCSGAAPKDKREGVRSLLRVPHYPNVFVAGLLFDFAKIAMSFIGPFYINDTTHSPRLVQLTGSATWGCLLLGPCFGMLSDRVDRRRTVMTVLIIELCQSLVVGLLLATGRMQPAFMLMYMVSAGVCRVLDTTSRPALVRSALCCVVLCDSILSKTLTTTCFIFAGIRCTARLRCRAYGQHSDGAAPSCSQRRHDRRQSSYRLRDPNARDRLLLHVCGSALRNGPAPSLLHT